MSQLEWGSDLRGTPLPVADAMDKTPQTIPLSASPREVAEILKEGTAVLVNDENGFHGLITRVDMINYIAKGRF